MKVKKMIRKRSQLKEPTRYLNPTNRIIREDLKASQKKTFLCFQCGKMIVLE